MAICVNKLLDLRYTVWYNKRKGGFDMEQLTNLLEEAAEEIENCYGRETELSERLREASTGHENRNSNNESVKPIMGNGVSNPLGQYYEAPTCPACGDVTYSMPQCPFCGQPFTDA